MKFLVEIKCDSAAFFDQQGEDHERARSHEIVRVLRELANRAEEVGASNVERINDINGHKAATVVLTDNDMEGLDLAKPKILRGK